MEVDQKYVTTIRLHDAKGCDINLARDGDSYQLRLESANNVVHISLGLADVRKLCQQMVMMDTEENWKAQYVAPEYRSLFFNGAPRSFQESMARWFAKMAGDMGEPVAKR